MANFWSSSLTRATWGAGAEGGDGRGLSLFYLYATKHTSPPHYQAAICRALQASLLHTGPQRPAWYPQRSPWPACGNLKKKKKNPNTSMMTSLLACEKKRSPPLPKRKLYSEAVSALCFAQISPYLGFPTLIRRSVEARGRIDTEVEIESVVSTGQIKCGQAGERLRGCQGE